MDEALFAYLRVHDRAEHPALVALRGATDAREHASMQSAPEQALFLQMLLRLIGARRVLEVGTFTGCGALAMALALPDDGEVVTLDANADTVTLGREYWQRAGVADKITPRIGLALESLDALLAEGETGRFDMAFIDADKKAYAGYFEACLKLVSGGGLLALDNTLWRGEVAVPDNRDKQTEALRALNIALRDDPRLSDVCLLPLGDGLTLARKA